MSAPALINGPAQLHKMHREILDSRSRIIKLSHGSIKPENRCSLGGVDAGEDREETFGIISHATYFPVSTLKVVGETSQSL